MKIWGTLSRKTKQNIRPTEGLAEVGGNTERVVEVSSYKYQPRFVSITEIRNITVKNMFVQLFVFLFSVSLSCNINASQKGIAAYYKPYQIIAIINGIHISCYG